MRIAIVGSGIAGNVVAHKLHRDHDITVFEANSYVGGHSNTQSVATDDGDLALDTGFIVFNDRTYPNFQTLLDEFDVASEPTSMSFAVHSPAKHLEYNGSTLNTLFSQRRNLLRPSFLRMIREILRFNREAPDLLNDATTNMSLDDYLRRNAYGTAFREYYLYPMGAAIWSAETATMRQMPATFFVRFFHNHGLLSIKDRPTWRVIKGGSREYVDRLVQDFRDRIRINSAVTSITRQTNHVVVNLGDAEPELFDRVFLACHSDEALKLLNNPLPLEESVLGAIPYQRNEAVLHTDRSLMPTKRRTWGAWNYKILDAPGDAPVAVTYYLNRLQNLQTETDYFVTLNDSDNIAPKTILKRFNYSHPVFTADSVAAQSRHSDVNGLDKVYFCGAYWRNGFHEDGVVSALAAIDHFNRNTANEQLHLQRTA